MDDQKTSKEIVASIGIKYDPNDKPNWFIMQLHPANESQGVLGVLFFTQLNKGTNQVGNRGIIRIED